MNLIASSGFVNPKKSQGLIVFADGHGPLDKSRQLKDGRHPSGVHKGERFSIGGDAPLSQLGQDEIALVVLLQHCKCIETTDGDEGKRNIARITKELEQEARYVKEQKELTAAGSQRDVVKQVMDELLSAGWTAPKVKPATA